MYSIYQLITKGGEEWWIFTFTDVSRFNKYPQLSPTLRWILLLVHTTKTNKQTNKQGVYSDDISKMVRN